MKQLAWILMIAFLAAAANAEDTENSAQKDTPDEVTAPVEPAGTDPDAPKTLSGMSILGNEEAPKSLVIIPWKSSEIGSDLGMDDSLSERAEPVDREVFLRELEFYEIRSGE